MSDIENTRYQVFIENQPKNILCSGTIWECERWIRKNGVIDTAYIIDQIKEKSQKTNKVSRKQKSKPTSENTHPQTVKKVNNKVELLF